MSEDILDPRSSGFPGNPFGPLGRRSAATAPTILLGPQRFEITAGQAVESLGVEGAIATINAGWEEREDDDAELTEVLGGRARNLRLHHRMFDLLAKDAEFAAAALELRDRHDELVDFYRLRLTHSLAAVRAVLQRTSRLGVGPVAAQDAIETVRALDRWYLDRLGVILAEFEERAARDESELIAWHRGEIAAILAESGAVVLTGGNVATLLHTLWLFDAVPPDKPVVAWSAGAMALTDAIVLFYDFAPRGSGAAELYAPGLGRLPGVIALPHAHRRLALDDHHRMAVLNRRFPDHAMVLLDEGAYLSFPAVAPRQIARPPAGSQLLTADGAIGQVRHG